MLFRSDFIAYGGGGILTMYGEDGKLRGIEAVIDKDLEIGRASCRERV